MITRPMSFRLRSRFSRSGTRLPTKTNTQSPRALIKSGKPPCARERVRRGGACAGAREGDFRPSSSPQSPHPLPPNPPRTPRGGHARPQVAGWCAPPRAPRAQDRVGTSTSQPPANGQSGWRSGRDKPAPTATLFVGYRDPCSLRSSTAITTPSP